ncbi:MAG: Mur ligase family protein [Candidatus Margulisiibacteriota bacterium]
MYVCNSKLCQPGDTFICLPGGEASVADAQARGATTVLHMTRAEMGVFANKTFDNPSEKLTVIGVTGTNGKTTVTHLIAQGLTAAGFKSAVLGTLNAPLTTPESIQVLEAMKQHVDAGGTHFVMEVSSHAIDQGRIDPIHFSIRVLTNITRDHLDYHGTFENYKATKLKFMRAGTPAIFPEDYAKETIDYPTQLLGEFNHQNIQAAQAALKACGLDAATIAKALGQAKPPAGRLEPVRAGQPFDVLVDYAHTPDGLENILKTLSPIAKAKQGKLLVVFGCGGDRDRGKRPEMGRIGAELADVVILTQDNPRTEDPKQIMSDILAGIPATFQKLHVIDDRRQAIELAIRMAQKDDVVAIAGKGHETYQIIGTEKTDFDDRIEAQKAIESRLAR